MVMAIVSTAKRDLSIVADSEDLLDFVKERTLDKKVREGLMLLLLLVRLGRWSVMLLFDCS